ncbi:MAG: YARHG domain-containing protein [Tyzzerella sp.]|nr:YARHG domain-containing protein [Tyzzerella sp.]
MEYNLVTAIEQMKKNEESGLNYIYSKTYNYVYLRAKNILKRENDIQQLMRDVYLKMLEASAEIEPENMYEWLGKTAYTLGCGYYRKKKAREVTCLEIDKYELTPRKIMNLEDTVEVIEDGLEQLPDLYQATFYAFYYDYMTIEDIAEVMDCTAGIIINRLNYTRKYMIKALENYQEEKKVKVAFSVEAVCAALRKWSVDHCLGMTAAQSVYAEICKGANLKPSAFYLEGKEFAGVNNTVVYHKADDWAPIEEQVEKYRPKSGIDKRVLGIIAGIVVLVIVIIVAVALLGKSGDGESKKNADSNQVEEQKDNQDADNADNQADDETDDQDADGQNADSQQQDDSQQSEPSGETTNASEYILPESATRALTRADLQGLTKEQLRLARNEIFARHGMIFGVEDLDTYFSSKSWYEPTVQSSEFYDKVEMSLIEEGNIELIQEVESGM